MSDMYGSKKRWCVAASYSSGRYVFSVVRDSRMWCPHGIRRDSWVWGEQGTLEMMNSPHKLGDEALVERMTLVSRKRGDPWVRWLLLLNLIISLIIIIVGSPRPRHPLLACAPLHFPTKVFTKSKQNPYVAAVVFCCLCVFLVLLVQGFSWLPF